MRSDPLTQHEEIRSLREELAALKQALKEERAFKARYQLLIENSDEWLWEVDKEGVYTYVSPRVTEVFGYEPEELIGRTPFHIMPPDEAKRVGAEFAEIVRYQRIFSKLPNRCMHKDGHILEVETSGVPIYDDEGCFAGYRGVDHDRSAEKHYQEELQEKNDLLTWRNTLLTQIVEQKTGLQLENLKLEQRISEVLEQSRPNAQQIKLMQLGDMINVIAHQWRQPLSAISARASYLYVLTELEDLDMESVREASHFIEQQCARMSKTMEVFLAFGRPQEDEALFEMREAVNTAIEIMRPQLQRHGVEVTLVDHTEGAKIIGMNSMIEQVVINLLANAREAFGKEHDAPSITVELTTSPTPAIIVEDNAGGIPEELSGKIFTEYFTTKKAQNGSGIGLYLGKEIMEKYFDGTLQHTPIEQGSRFSMLIGSSRLVQT